MNGQRIFLLMAAHRKQMTISPKFCTACGSPVAARMRFCSQCGQPVVGQGTATPATQPQQPAAPAPAAPGGDERILGIVPFLEQGLLSVIHYTLIVTDRRLIFCHWDPDKDEAMSEADDTMMQESCTISETKDEIAHFLAKDWSGGPWQRYRSMAPDAIIAGAPGSIVIPVQDIGDATIVCETLTSTQDNLRIRDAKHEQKFDLMYSQGPYLARILGPLLGGRLTMEDHLHRRRGLDRLLSGQEYK
jgi:hypothetical protein